MSLLRVPEYPTKQQFENTDDYIKRLRDRLQEEAADRIQDFDILQLGNVSWVDIRAYGASAGNAAADNDIAIQAAIDALVDGQYLYIPHGKFAINNIHFDPTDGGSDLTGGCGIICHGVLEGDATGIALRIGPSDSTNRTRYYIQGLRVESSARDITAGRVGIEVRNVYHSYIDIRQIYGYETGLRMLGSGAKGCVFNDVHIGRLFDNKYSLHLNADTSGWCNDNSFYGGSFIWATGSPYAGYKHIWVDHYATKPLDNNRFYSSGLEAGTAGTSAHGVYCEGVYTYFMFPRFEMNDAKFEFTSNGDRNVVFFGYGINTNETITDGGSHNCVFGDNTTRLEGGADARPVLRLCNINANTNPTLLIENTAKATVAQLRGDGKGLFKGGVGVGNDAAGDTLGNLVKQTEVFDEDGASLGYIPIYDAITVA